jgi:hypothetical protein
MNTIVRTGCTVGTVAIALVPFPAIATDTVHLTFNPEDMSLDVMPSVSSDDLQIRHEPTTISPPSNSSAYLSAIAPDPSPDTFIDSSNVETNVEANELPDELSFTLPNKIVSDSTDIQSYPSSPTTLNTSDPVIAVAIGHAEGTRTAEGDRTWAYYGHQDPGNGRWNLGSFSYQHCTDQVPPCSTPEEADARQLQRLRQQSIELQHQARAMGLQLTTEELLNGLDLANQAPLAALDRGYLDWLKQARERGKPGPEAILWARVRSFIDPDTQQWNAPGLGNNIHQITADQQRRMDAIARVMQEHDLQTDESLWASQ